MSGSVLVVDDEAGILDLVSLILGSLGYQVQTATTGSEALEILKEGMPDVILLDMRMPVMNGWEFVRAFRKAYDHLCPIIAFTAAEDARGRAEDIGAEDYLAKPFEIAELIETVAKHIRKEDGAA